MLEQIVQSYKTVIEDIIDDDTWLEEPKRNVLSLLRTRLMELETIWSIPDELWHAEFDGVFSSTTEELRPDLEDPDHCSSCNGVGEDRYEQRCVSCGGSGRES
jgi:hypothetical protein